MSRVTQSKPPIINYKPGSGHVLCTKHTKADSTSKLHTVPLCLHPTVLCKAEVFLRPVSSVPKQHTPVSQLYVFLYQQHDLPPGLRKSVPCQCWFQHMALSDLWHQTCRQGHHTGHQQPHSQVIHCSHQWLRYLKWTSQQMQYFNTMQFFN